MPILDNTAETVAEAFRRMVIQRFGCPKFIIMDNATYNRALPLEKMANTLGVQLRFTSPYHPQANGRIENFNKFLGRALKMHGLDHPEMPWHSHLSAISWAWNSSPSRVTKISPFQLMFGADPVFPTNPLMRRNEGNWLQNLVKWKDMAREARLLEHAKAAEYLRKNFKKPKNLKVGDKVLFLEHYPKIGQTKKLQIPWSVPAEVVTIRGPVLKLMLNGQVITRNVASVRPFRERKLEWVPVDQLKPIAQAPSFKPVKSRNDPVSDMKLLNILSFQVKHGAVLFTCKWIDYLRRKRQKQVSRAYLKKTYPSALRHYESLHQVPISIEDDT